MEHIEKRNRGTALNAAASKPTGTSSGQDPKSGTDADQMGLELKGKRSILVIDDEKDNLDYLQAELRSRFDISLANGGSNGIAMFGEKHFDLVLTDVRMAGLDGIHVLKTVKQIQPECEVLLMSGYSDLDIVIDAMNEGAFAFVTKPILREVLFSRIDHAIAVMQARENQELVLKELKNELLVQSRFAQRLSALAAISGGIAHELKQPLSGIGMYSATVKKMLQRDIAIEREFLKETMDKIERQVERASAVIDHIREFESSGETPAATSLKLVDAVWGSMDLFSLQLQDLGIALKVDIPQDLVVLADRYRFEQVIINMVSNARDGIAALPAGPSGGREKRIEIAGSRSGQEVIVDVRDTGAGIPAGLQPAIFDPFVSGKLRTEGSGLGLFICRTVLAEYGATIRLHSTGTEGTIFRLSFPEI